MKKIKEQFSKITITKDFVARVLIGLLFVYSGIEKIVYFSDTTNFISDTITSNQTLAQFLIIISLLIELVLGLGLMIGKYKRDLIIKGLTVYVLILTMVIDYNYFGGINTFFLKNIAILGGLIALLGDSKAQKYTLE